LGGKLLVDLFGKKKLEDRIIELESGILELEKGKDELIHTLEKREEKIRKLTSANQEANLALKAALLRTAASLAVPLPIAAPAKEDKKPAGIKFAPREMDKLIKRLKTCRSPEDDLLIAINADGVPNDANLLSESEKAALAIKSKRGLIVLKYPQLFTLLLVPPFPIPESSFVLGNTFQLDWFQEMMETPVLVVSAHAGATFLGVAYSKEGFEIEEFVESQVKEKHSKGGWSQKRFERLREEDIKNHLDSVLEKLSELLGKYRSVVRFAICGGDENLLKQIIPAIGMPVIERRLERHNERPKDGLLEEIYGFTCYHI
jgi:hypothetical protein